LNNNNWKIAKPKKKWTSEVESILWDYPELKMNYQEFPSCISFNELTGIRGAMSDTTAKFGIRRAMNQEEAVILINKIEIIFKRLKPELQKVCELYYWEKLKPSEIANKLQITSMTVYNWLNDVIFHYERLL